MAGEKNRDPLDPVPLGLVLFPPGTPRERRRRRWIFLGCYLLAAALVLWPVYPLFSGVFPLILGLPLSLAWVVLALTIDFFALLWLFRGDRAHGDRNDDDAAGDAAGGS